ncbi:MAG: glycosyltransferase, partial [Bacteroidales bacterium]
CSPERKFNRFHSFLRKVLYCRSEGIIAQTEKAKVIYKAMFQHNNIKVIGNPIRKINVRPGTLKENIVLMVGRLIETKHQDKLIGLFLNLSKTGWRLVLVGYDHLKQNNSEKLKRIISEHNAENSVILEGKQADVDSYYMRSKIFAFTSSSEGFPNVIGEAMSAGLPIVAFDCVAGPSDMIADNVNGFLVPLFDYEQFQKKLGLLMDQPDLRDRLGKEASENIEMFSISRIGEVYLDFILK